MVSKAAHHMEWAPKKPAHALGVDPGPTVRGSTYRAGYKTVAHMQRVWFSPMQDPQMSV